LFVGQGGDREGLVRYAGELVPRGIIRFLEGGLEPMEVVAGADVGVLLTDPKFHAEGCSNSIMEYMACELPVVCSDGGGNRELVADGVSGFVIPPRDPAALADRLEFLRLNGEERLRFGLAGKRRLLDEFTVERMVASYVGVYSELVAGHVL
jgi:glycosyltransferase involved in cell wall biosynthesis